MFELGFLQGSSRDWSADEELPVELCLLLSRTGSRASTTLRQGSHQQLAFYYFY